MPLPTSFLSYAGYRHLKLSLLALAVATAAFVFHDPPGGRAGDTWVGYGLGGACAALVLWLLWFGVRKRRYDAGGAPLQGWLSAHVYWGLTLLFLVPLHSAFQFGWNVHTLAYALLCFVVLSGMIGVLVYATMPDAVSRNRSGRRFDSFLQEIGEVDAECRALAGGLPDVFAQAVAVSIQETPLGGGFWRKLRASEPRCGTSRALHQVDEATDDAKRGDTRESTNRLLELLTRKQVLVRRVRQDLRQRTLMNLWLTFHVPLSVASVAAVAVHVFVVFYYW